MWLKTGSATVCLATQLCQALAACTVCCSFFLLLDREKSLPDRMLSTRETLSIHHSWPDCSSFEGLELLGVHISQSAVLMRRVMPVQRFLLLLLLLELPDLGMPLEAC